jgi:hypothetical protein
MPIDLPPIEYTLPKPNIDTSKNTIAYTTAKQIFDLNNEFIPPDTTIAKEKLQDEVRIGSKIDNLSSTWAATYELYIWAKRVGAMVKCESQRPWWKAKAMFIGYSQASKALFDQDTEGNVFPNIEKLQEYFINRWKETGQERQITLITTGPTFSKSHEPTLSWVNYDNGIAVGTNTSLNEYATKDKGIVIISWWTLKLSHTQELTEQALQALIAKSSDVMTMSSLKRNGKLNLNASLWGHPHSHSLVQFKDGTRWEIILNDCTEKEKQRVMELLDVSRAVYADADSKNNYLDGIWIQTNDWLKYSHPTNWDLFMNANITPGAVEKDNMPGIIIHYVEEIKYAQ